MVVAEMVAAVVSSVDVEARTVPPARTKTDLSLRLARSPSPAETTAAVVVVTSVEETAEVVVASSAEREAEREVEREASVETVVVATAPRRRELLSLLSNNSKINDE